MGTWSTSIKGNDTFLDIYHNFYVLYNQGMNPEAVSIQILSDYQEMFNDYDDKNNALFGLALAQWETKSQDLEIFKKVKEIIENGDDLKAWEGIGGKELTKRKIALNKFLSKISSPKEKIKRRTKAKVSVTSIEIVRTIAPDNLKVFYAGEYYTNGVYVQSAAAMEWERGGGGIFAFIDKGKSIDAHWIDSQTLEIIHDKEIFFHQKRQSSYYSGDEVTIVYKPV